jgi:hypothetical protein
MRALIERQLYRAAIVMPWLILMRLMVTLDFNLLQVTVVVVLKSTRYVFHAICRQRDEKSDRRTNRSCLRRARPTDEKACQC